MSDIEPDKLLDMEDVEMPGQAASDEITNADLLSLMKTYFTRKLTGIERNFADTTHDLARKVQKSESSFKFKGNKVQFDLNSDLLDNIDIAVDCIEHRRYDKAVKVLKESGQSLKKRNKLIRIADKSEGGWKTVDEYLSDDVASDSEDEKRIRAADGRAVKKLKTVKQDKRQNIKKRPAESAGGPSSIAHNELGTSVTTVVCMDIGQKTVKKGEIQQLPEEHQTERSPDILKVQNVDNFDSFYDYESGTSCINVKNRLKNSLDFWKNINASKFILDLIENGYKIPLINEPESVLLRNNKSALEHKDFVEKAVQELIDASLIEEVSNRPHVVNPLTVSINSSGKGRLILDLRHVNKQVVYSKIKFEDWKTASQFLTSDCFGFAFDLKAGYHHINIFPNHQKYLGFSWKFGETVKYFVFTVLPFGLCSAGYVFTKVVRPLIAHWRKDGIKITVYLDDGLCLAETEKLCCEQSVRVKNDLILSGFVPNKDKCIWTPVQTLVWLGFTWNLKSSLMELPLIKIENFINLIDVILSKAFKVKIRLLAKLCGKIISFSPAIGNVTQIMTRCTFSVINLRQDWDQYVDLRQHSDSIQEIMFWKQNIHCLKPVPLLRNNSEFNVFTDASDIGAGGYLQGTDYIAHRQWSVTEATKSSTWREIKAIELTLDSFAKVLEHSSVTFFTDNQNAVSIIKKGSKLPHLQVSCGAEGTLVVPKWQSAAFWPLIFKQNSEYACYVVDVLEFHEAERIFVAGNNLNSLFANGQFHGKILATIFSVGFWSQNEQIKHPELKALFNSLSSTILDARAKSTVEKYADILKDSLNGLKNTLKLNVYYPVKNYM
ncbi:unnamed protein product [Mytilus edulis]|uniref:Reverse transcriptase domain-containing protein n=1 Tax=Mytilus edulis TaxID=6550 RepID=A0A8S3TN23_MYTED|nr:unnamed protein product [Mytilus edulis]